MAFGTAAVKVLNGGYNIAAVVVAIMVFVFILTSEKIIKEIFHFRATSMSDTLGNAALTGALLSRIGSGAKKKGGGGGGSNKYADPNNMLTPNSNATNVKPGGDSSRPKLGNANSSNIAGTSTNQGGNNTGASAGAGAGTNVSTTNTTASQSNNIQQPLKQRGPLRKALGWYINTSLKGGAALSGGAFFLGATGDLRGVLPMAGAMGSLAGKGTGHFIKKDRQKRLAKAYNDYANHIAMDNPSLTTDQINAITRQRAVNLMQNNVSGPLDDYDKQLLETMNDLNETYKSFGMGEAERNEQINKDFGDIETGKISEIYAPSKYKGNVRKVANKSNKWGFGGGNPTANQNNQGGGSSSGSGAGAGNAPNPNNQNNSAQGGQGKRGKGKRQGQGQGKSGKGNRRKGQGKKGKRQGKNRKGNGRK